MTIHTKWNFRLGLAIAIVGMSSVFAADSSKMPPVSSQTNVTYLVDIRPIFQANCITCHGETRQRRRLRLDSLKAVLAGCEDGPVIFPGKSDQGDLILEICGLGDHDMPPYPSTPPLLSHEHPSNVPAVPGPDGKPAPKPLTADQISLIRAWVVQGAK